MKNKFEEFKHNVFCRRDTNQMKARNIWKDIKNNIDENDCKLFEIEWNHFIDDEIDVDDFSEYFNEYVDKHFKK